jgi:hypothetical protein
MLLNTKGKMAEKKGMCVNIKEMFVNIQGIFINLAPCQRFYNGKILALKTGTKILLLLSVVVL